MQKTSATMVSRFLVHLLMLSLLCISLPAMAQADNKAAAREHFEKGVAAFADRRFGEAAAEFDAAYRISPAFVVLYNIGQVNVALGRSVEAVDAFDKYLKQGASSISAARRREVSAEIEKQLANIGTVSVRTFPDGAEIRVDGSLAGRTPLARAVRVNAGRHTIEAILAGHTTQIREADVAGRAELAIELTLEPVVATTPAPAPVPALPIAPPPAAAPAPAPAPASPPAIATLAAPERLPEHVIEKSVVERVIEKPAAELDRAPPPAPPPPPPSTPRSSVSWQRIAGFVVTAGGLAAATAGGLMAYDGANRARDSNERLQGLMDQAYDEELANYNAAKSRNQRGWTIAGVGAAVVLGGVLLIATAPEKSNTVALAPWITAQAGGVAMAHAW